MTRLMVITGDDDDLEDQELEADEDQKDEADEDQKDEKDDYGGTGGGWRSAVVARLGICTDAGSELRQREI